MKMRKVAVFVLVTAAVLAVLFTAVSCKKTKEEAKVDYGPSIPAEKTAPVTWAGCRRSDYGWKEAMFKKEPTAEEWIEYGARMGAEYEGSIPTFVWIVGSITGNEGAQRCSVNFPINGTIDGVEDFPADMKVLTAVRKYNSEYTVFVKHWDMRWLPSKMDGLIYVNDSQGFADMDQVISEFSGWAKHYAPQPVMFQIGYKRDSRIWNAYANPAREFGQAIVDECKLGNDIGIIWVDMTLSKVIYKTDK